MCHNSGLYGEHNRLNMTVDICENGVIIRGHLQLFSNQKQQKLHLHKAHTWATVSVAGLLLFTTRLYCGCFALCRVICLSEQQVMALWDALWWHSKRYILGRERTLVFFPS